MTERPGHKNVTGPSPQQISGCLYFINTILLVSTKFSVLNRYR